MAKVFQLLSCLVKKDFHRKGFPLLSCVCCVLKATIAFEETPR